MRLKIYLLLFFYLLSAVSCSVSKDIVYFQGVDSLTPEQLKEMSHESYSTRLTYDDLLSITVANWDPASVTPFNPPVFAYSTSEGEQPITASESLYTYLIDKEGYIEFPLLGKIQAAGLTKEELASTLKGKLSHFVADTPLVKVQLLNFKVTLMGEFYRPGSYTIKSDRVSILDVIGMAGDLPMSANRKNLLVIRESNGTKEIHRLDITRPDIFTSPCFYLRQNDVVYAEPIKQKQRSSRTNSDRSFIVSLVTSAISSISVIVAMVISLKNN